MVLIVLWILILYNILPIGDYCTGLIGGLGITLISFLLAIIFMYIINSNLVEVKKKKQRFDFIPLLIMLFFGISVFIISSLEDKKFWTDVRLIGTIETEKSRLVLYENKTFALAFSEIDYSCTYQGNYKIDKDTIILERLDIDILTNNVFSSNYLINRDARVLEPVETNSKILRIQ